MKASVNGIDIRYEISGSGPWVTFSHSLACDLSMWDEQLAAFEQRYTVLRYDTRGHGSSSAPLGAYRLEQLAEDAIALLDALRVKRTHFVGLSMGGMIAQHIALMVPDRLASLVLADTTSRYPPDAAAVWQERIRIVSGQGMQPVVQPTLERWFTAPYRARHPEVMSRIGALICGTPVAGYVGCCHAISNLNLTDRLGGVRLPTLVLVGEQDPGTPVAMAQEVAAAIPDARLKVIPDAAHLSNIEQALNFNALLRDFLDAQP